MNKRYKVNKTISMKQFIAEFGLNFSDQMKKRLLELDERCVLTRKEPHYRLDIKHVEHIKYNFENDSEDGNTKKEYVYGQFIVLDEFLYFSEKCGDNNDAMQAPIVDTIYSHLNSNIVHDIDRDAKAINDDNIDYVVDTILSVFPNVSEGYKEIMRGIMMRTKK